MYQARTRSPAPPENSTSDTSNGAYRPGSCAVSAAGLASPRASRSRVAHQSSSPAGSAVAVRYSRSRSSGMSYQGMATLAFVDFKYFYPERTQGDSVHDAGLAERGQPRRQPTVRARAKRRL